MRSQAQYQSNPILLWFHCYILELISNLKWTYDAKASSYTNTHQHSLKFNYDTTPELPNHRTFFQIVYIQHSRHNTPNIEQSNLIHYPYNSQSHLSYEYGPFGELVAESGSYVSENTYKFSTKPQDTETGYYYYGFRYYNATNGRWLNRDPIGEFGGINVYSMISNNLIGLYDFLGLSAKCSQCCSSEDKANVDAAMAVIANFSTAKTLESHVKSTLEAQSGNAHKFIREAVNEARDFAIGLLITNINVVGGVIWSISSGLSTIDTFSQLYREAKQLENQLSAFHNNQKQNADKHKQLVADYKSTRKALSRCASKKNVDINTCEGYQLASNRDLHGALNALR